ncbi:hypothetical protein HanRHA438_Chr04g0176581 [Helianthus annuus]|uniref:Uncharacterized protein n=1 Tax=Helianthus annuus TaxID=4232 RepID=A0A9K3J7F8_HELAN|nr:hypothetical protein HanXRQr2_Chr04g0166921 [Helianthus annuus]KAJ0581089.1 hypothetical protein HanHA300_Chr04g0136961 [Helianthus annuus]KAJ0588910.1 hypothetical protein HanIR_Chr04g0180151 [Helianthus annuus]KAJ0597035.1 hypothetical protein HanHA89_Chr04g0149911 [Helianthus annuus]KAJ0757719.1 hypothetical protein HanLR1_Chr04g0142041 [Helianthus annuus]
MDSETLKRLDVYRGVKKENEPKNRQKFAAIKKPDYVAPEDDKCRHDNSGSDDETKRMEQLNLKKTRWWFVKEERSRKRTSKVTSKVVIKGKTKKQESPERLVDKSFESFIENVNIYVADIKKKKSPPHLVDEPLIPPQEVIDQGIDLLKMSFADYEKLSTAQVDKDAAKTTENVEAGGEGLKETFVEGEVHTDSSETESENDLTQMAPTSYVSGKLKLKKIPKKKKASD